MLMSYEHDGVAVVDSSHHRHIQHNQINELHSTPLKVNIASKQKFATTIIYLNIY